MNQSRRKSHRCLSGFNEAENLSLPPFVSLVWCLINDPSDDRITYAAGYRWIDVHSLMIISLFKLDAFVDKEHEEKESREKKIGGEEEEEEKREAKTNGRTSMAKKQKDVVGCKIKFSFQ